MKLFQETEETDNDNLGFSKSLKDFMQVIILSFWGYWNLLFSDARDLLNSFKNTRYLLFGVDPEPIALSENERELVDEIEKVVLPPVFSSKSLYRSFLLHI